MSQAQANIGDDEQVSDDDNTITGRFMLPDQVEHQCRVINLTIQGATFLTSKVPLLGMPIVAYVGDLGRIEAVAGIATTGGFDLTFSMTGARLDRLRGRIEKLLRDGVSKGEAGRKFMRSEPHPSVSQITLPDGRVYPCEVLDISVAGAGIKTDVIPGLGTFLMLGRMRGRVVRYLDNGVAIEFIKQLNAHQMRHMGDELSA